MKVQFSKFKDKNRLNISADNIPMWSEYFIVPNILIEYLVKNRINQMKNFKPEKEGCQTSF